MSNLTEAPRPSLLSDESLSVVQATAPVVVAAAAITAHFYPRMFTLIPSRRESSTRKSGHRRAEQSLGRLRRRVRGATDRSRGRRHLITLMRRIAYKHVSWASARSSTRLSARNPLASVGEVLGDAVTPEVAAAWSEVYWLFALQLVAEEARLYQQANVDPDQPTRPYRGGPPHRGNRRRHLPCSRTDRRWPFAGHRARPVRLGVRRPAHGDRQPRQYTLSSTARPRASRSPYGGARRERCETARFRAICMIMWRSDTCSM